MSGYPSAAGIVVGIDGSECSRQALLWARREAERSDEQLTAVYAWQLPLVPSFTSPPMPLFAERHRLEVQAADAARIFVAAAAGTAGGREPDVRTVLGRPADVLLDEAEGTRMLVVGSQGHSALSRFLLGSVSSAVLHRARTSVTIVRGEPVPTGPARVVVGFDGSRDAADAMEVAAREAALRGAELHVVRVWNYVMSPELAHERASSAADAERATDEELAKAVSVLPHVPSLRTQTVHGYEAAKELVSSAEGAELLVVGTRGAGGLQGMLLGSVSSACSLHAPCPVLVVRRAAG